MDLSAAVTPPWTSWSVTAGTWPGGGAHGDRDLRLQDPRVPDFADRLGLAMQLTNIARDVQEDAREGRVYLPGGLAGAAWPGAPGHPGQPLVPALRELMRELCETAEGHYEAVPRLLPDSERAAMKPALVMAGLYRPILGELRRRDYQVFLGKVGYPIWRKLLIALRILGSRTTLKPQVAIAGAGLAGLGLALDLARARTLRRCWSGVGGRGPSRRWTTPPPTTACTFFLGAFTCCLARLELLGSCHELRELGTSCRVEWQGRLLTLPLGAPRPQTLLALARLGRPGWQLAAGLWRLLDCRASQGEYAAALPPPVPACAPVRWWRPSGANGSCRSSTRLWTNWTRCWPCAPAGLAGGSAPPSPAGGGAFPGGPVDPAPNGP